MRVKLMLAILLVAGAAHAITIEKPLADVAQEQVAQRVIHELKCVVCEGQALADSDATFAREIRAEIRRMAAEGQSAAAIRDYFRSRYGDRILLAPPVDRMTGLLWFAPLLLALAGGIGLWRYGKRRRNA